MIYHFGFTVQKRQLKEIVIIQNDFRETAINFFLNIAQIRV